MGGSESAIESYIRRNGIDALYDLIILKKKITWLQQSCNHQINKKIDDQIKHMLFNMDQFVNQKKQITLSRYKKIKAQILLKQGFRVKNYQQKHGKSLQNIYGKNHLMDKFNLLKINFHVESHIIKKRVKKAFDQKICFIQNDLLKNRSDQFKSKQSIKSLFINGKQPLQVTNQQTEIESQLQKFKKQIIEQLNFDEIFWPNFDQKIRQTQDQVTKVFNQAQKNTKNMKKDLQNNWNIFNIESF